MNIIKYIANQIVRVNDSSHAWYGKNVVISDFIREGDMVIHKVYVMGENPEDYQMIPECLLDEVKVGEENSKPTPANKLFTEEEIKEIVDNSVKKALDELRILVNCRSSMEYDCDDKALFVALYHGTRRLCVGSADID